MYFVRREACRKVQSVVTIHARPQQAQSRRGSGRRVKRHRLDSSPFSSVRGLYRTFHFSTRRAIQKKRKLARPIVKDRPSCVVRT